MNRRILSVLMAAVLVASLTGLADASSFRIRFDPNDSPRRTDIQKVVSDLTVDRVFLKIVSWQRLTPWRMNHEGYIIRLDSSGGEGFDRVVEIYPGAKGGPVLSRSPSRSEIRQRSWATSRPRAQLRGQWRAVFPDHGSPVSRGRSRFYVAASGDRAPNTGLYIWI